jgi:hypothetical protein
MGLLPFFYLNSRTQPVAEGMDTSLENFFIPMLIFYVIIIPLALIVVYIDENNEENKRNNINR